MENTDPNAPVKKNWQSPVIMLIAANSINGGAFAGAHEANYKSSFTSGGRIYFVTPGGKTTGGVHGFKLASYVS